MADSVTHDKACTDFAIPANIGELVDIHEDDKANEHEADLLHHLAEQSWKFTEIERLRFVHWTWEDVRFVPKKIIDGFNENEVSINPKMPNNKGFLRDFLIFLNNEVLNCNISCFLKLFETF